MPQSLLFVGPEGSGKEAVALELARHAICTPENFAAPAGRKVSELRHPDLYYTCPVERSLTRDAYRQLLDAKAREPLGRVRQPSSAVLPIGDRDDPGLVSVRAIRRFVQAPPFEGRRKVVVIGDAHRMNRQAANALLKTLEEPPRAVLLMLCTHQPHLLPSTVPSRCAKIPVAAFTEAELARHLQERHEVGAAEAARMAAVAGGNARRALDLIDEASREIAAWAETLLAQLWTGRRGELCASTERIAKGQPPTGAAKKKTRTKGSSDASLAASRDVGMRLLDFLAADLVLLLRRDAGVELDESLAARLPDPRGVNASAFPLAVRRLSAARAELGRNLNVGLVLMHAVLEVHDLLHGAALRA